MKFKSIRKRDEQHELSRRALIGWMTAAGAALSVPLWKTFEIIEGTHGKAYAQGGACLGANRHVEVNWEVGSFAWISQVTPWKAMAAGANTPGISYQFQDNRGYEFDTGVNGNSVWVAPPMQGIEDIITNPAYLWTLMVGGQNETHTSSAVTNSTTNLGNTTLNSASQYQLATQVPRLLSGVAVGNVANAGSLSLVNDSDGMVALLNSAATSAGGLLSREPNPAVYKQHVDAFLSLNRLSGRATTQSAFEISKIAGFTVGQNFATLLRPTPAQMQAFGLNGGVNGNAGLNGGMQDLGKFLITTANAFKAGLWANSAFSGDSGARDPHGRMNVGQLQSSRDHSMQIGLMYKEFFRLLSIDDPLCPGEPIWKNTVVVNKGDTMKQNGQGNWQDGTANGHNAAMVFGAGWLEAGQFGELAPGNNLTTWNANTGANDDSMTSQQLGAGVAGAINYAVTRGNLRDAELQGQVAQGPIVENLTG